MRWTIRRWFLGLALALTVLAAGRVARAQDETFTVSGPISWVSEDAIEVGGRRGLIDASTDIRSDGRSISVASLHRGMTAEMELDASGHALEIRVSGVAE